jgi:two-component system cell cycle response regulator DivK
MSLPFRSEPLGRIRDAARILVEQAADDEDHIEALVAAADTDMRRAVTELSDALDLRSSSVDELRRMLRLQLQRSVDGARAVRQLLARAHEQHVAAARLLSDVEGDRSGEAPPTDCRALRNSVLVVDDYQDVRELLSGVLQDAGFVVRMAGDGLEAVIAAHEMRPAVIVMDVTMPVLDGLEATRLIKAADLTRHARVIAYTGSSTLSGSLAEKLFVAVLQKPATPEVVVATVQQVASRVESTGDTTRAVHGGLRCTQ